MAIGDRPVLKHAFVQGSGVLYAPRVHLKIHPLGIPFPVELTIRRRKKVVLHDVPGLAGTIKEVLGEQDAWIQIRMELRDWDVPPVSKLTGQGEPVRARDVLEELYKIYRMEEPVEVTDAVWQEVSILGSAFEALGLVELTEPVSLFELLGIPKILFTSIQADKGSGPVISVILTGISDRDRAGLSPFLEETE
ncbi:MAG: hypothetical protein L3J76_00695 [Candidatus Hydrothermae bacterium]|nr:hypothetical protein [Candidatus Hydrothermae bacterium]